MEERELIRALQDLQQMRVMVERLDVALSVLTPEERLVVQYLLLEPHKGNAGKVCQALRLEPATVYRRRKRALRKLCTVLRR